MAKSIILTVTVLTILLLNLTYFHLGKDTRNRTDTGNDDYVNQTKIIQYNNKFSILGKWQRTAQSESNGGAKIYTTRIKNGEILSFEKNNKVKDEKGNLGTYTLDREKLKITLNKKEEYYFVYYDKKDVTKIYLNPVTPKYQIICDEGCAYTYTKR